MARPRLTESARVTIGLKVSEDDAARIDQVLARPEFAGWSRAEWCREIIRTALRYYVGDAPAPGAGPARATARPAAAQPESPEPRKPSEPRKPPEPRRQPEPPGPPEPAPAMSPGPAADTPSPAAGPGASLDAPEPSAQPECPHPAEARDWQTGTCAACGAILWD